MSDKTVEEMMEAVVEAVRALERARYGGVGRAGNTLVAAWKTLADYVKGLEDERDSLKLNLASERQKALLEWREKAAISKERDNLRAVMGEAHTALAHASPGIIHNLANKGLPHAIDALVARVNNLTDAAIRSKAAYESDMHLTNKALADETEGKKVLARTMERMVTTKTPPRQPTNSQLCNMLADAEVELERVKPNTDHLWKVEAMLAVSKLETRAYARAADGEKANAKFFKARAEDLSKALADALGALDEAGSYKDCSSPWCNGVHEGNACEGAYQAAGFAEHLRKVAAGAPYREVL